MILCTVAIAGKLSSAIEMDSSHTVGSLKDAIRAKQSPVLDHSESPANTLTLVLIFKDGIGGMLISDLRQRSAALDPRTYGDWPEEGLDTVSKFSETGDVEGTCFRSDDGYFFKVMKTGMKLSHYTDGLTLKVKEGLCHVLVLPKYIQRGLKFDPNNPTKNTRYKMYRERGCSLASQSTVTALVDQINVLYDHYESSQTIPFIVLEGSRGVGKTQMAFTLMDHFNVGYVPYMSGDSDSHQPIHKAFEKRSTQFFDCVSEDLASYSKDYDNDISITHLRASSDMKLISYDFIVSLLTGKRKHLKPISRSKALKRLARMTDQKRNVLFVDEFFGAINESVDINQANRRLRFMRNVAGALGIVFIVSSKRNSTMCIRAKVNGPSRGDDTLKLWCYVVSRFPPFVIPSDTNIPPWLRYILIRSRPWFSQIALQHYLNFGDVVSVPTYLDEMFKAVWDSVERERDFLSRGFLYGQACLLLSVNHVETQSDDGNDNLINKHFGQLDRKGIYPLYLSNKGLHNENMTDWNHHVALPSAEEDLLLHLAFLGGKGFRALDETISNVMETLESHQTFNMSFDESNDKVSELELEGIRFSAAALLASRMDGIRGINADKWIVSVMKELGIVVNDESFKTSTSVSLFLKNIEILFLGAPNVTWPDNLPEEYRKYMGKISLFFNDGCVGGRIASDVTFEVIRTSLYGRFDLESAFLKKPVDSKIHIICINSAVNVGYSRKRRADGDPQTYAEFVKQNRKLLGKVFVYALSDVGYEEFEGIVNDCRCRRVNHRDCAPTSFILVLQMVQ